MPTPHRPHQGFTLTEMIITLAIFAILVAVALPSYKSYVARTHRTVAKSLMTDLAARQEAYFLDHRGYALNLGNLGVPADANGTVYIDDSDQPNGTADKAIYQITLATSINAASCAASGSGSATRYALIATPIGTFSDPLCNIICLANNGDRGSSVANSLKTCWGR